MVNALGAVTGSFFDKAHTVINEHFAGQEQGKALADIIFGKYNPCGKLTATWYKDENELPHINDYGIYRFDTVNGTGRTYQYFRGSVLFPFGYGLSYTDFDYSGLSITNRNSASKDFDANDTLTISFDIKNTGALEGKEIAELYVSKIIPENMHDKKPARLLKGFAKVDVKPGETKKASITLPVSELAYWNNLRKKWFVEPGDYRIEIGKSSADIVLSEVIHVDGVWDAPLFSVYMDSSAYVLAPGETASLTTTATTIDAARVTPAQAAPVYESSDPSVATVNNAGVITAVGPGAALITGSVSFKGKTVKGTLAIAVK